MSRTSSTSEAVRPPSGVGPRSPARSPSAALAARLAGLVRLVHPFPSLLDGLVVAGIAVVAGAGPDRAAALGIGMTALQFGIGAVNDLVDAPRDAATKPSKPIPAGVVAPRAARAIAFTAFGVGLALSATAGIAVLVLAGLVVAIGFAYDFVWKGTAWSWVGFAAGIPLLPVYAWLGSSGDLPTAFAILIPAAMVAGVALALANSLADLERDVAAGIDSAAIRLGAGRTRRLIATLHAAVGLAAVASLGLLRDGATGPTLLAVGPGLALIALGVTVDWGADPRRRERGWELQAIGTGALAVGWIAALASAGSL